MSRSNKTDLVNPATRYFNWSGSEGAVQFYEKESKTNIVVNLPFKFLVLDRVFTVGGGVDRDGGYEGYWSNAVKNLKTQQIVVRSKGGEVCRGLYENIKGVTGVKFITGLYIGFFNEDKEFTIGYLKIGGAALTAWIEFTKQHRDVYAGAFSITDKEKKKKGSNTYYEPVFDFSSTITEETEAAAVELDTHVQEYLTAYFAQKGIEEVEHEFSGPKTSAAAAGSPDFPPSEYDAPDEEAF